MEGEPEELEQMVETYLENRYDGRFGVDTDLDIEDGYGYIGLAFDSEDSFPSLHEFLEEIRDEFSEDWNVKGDFNGEAGTYEVIIEEPE